MDTIQLGSGRRCRVTLSDPMDARFTVVLDPCEAPDCRVADEPVMEYCCRASFRPLTEAGKERLGRDWENQRHLRTSDMTDIEVRLLGEVLEALTVRDGGEEREIEILRLIPLVIRRCAAAALYEAYVRIVPSVVALMEGMGIEMVQARSILDGCDGRSVGDDGTDGDGVADDQITGQLPLDRHLGG